MKFGLVGVVFAMVFSLAVSANPLDSLKNTPATKYELGKVQLEIGALLLTQKLEDEKVGDTRFRVKKFSVSEVDGKLLLIANLKGKTKNINIETCSNIMAQLLGAKSASFSNLPKSLWPELSEKEQDSLKEYVKLSVKLISKDNADFSVQC